MNISVTTSPELAGHLYIESSCHFIWLSDEVFGEDCKQNIFIDCIMIASVSGVVLLCKVVNNQKAVDCFNLGFPHRHFQLQLPP